MSISPAVSLIDLSNQMNFEIDDVTKQELCFSETLVISCCHADSSATDLHSESTWTIIDTEISESESESEHEESENEVSTLQDARVPDDEIKEPVRLDLQEDDFHFFFFDHVTKKPFHKDISVIMVDKLPEINPRRRKGVCLCRSDDVFEPKCKCWMTICTCGATTTRTCYCGAVENICMCDPNNEPNPICTCAEESKICLCHPDKKPRPRCTCEEGEPCLCHPGIFPLPFCTCGGSKPCLCHPERGNTACNCGNGVNCTCKKGHLNNLCICGKTEVCFCGSDNIMRRICTCGFPEACICHSEGSMKPVCTCDLQPNECACHSDLIIRQICTCDNPDACICDLEIGGVKRVCVCGNSKACLCNDDKVLNVCTCTDKPCLCHKGEIREECLCAESPPSSEKGIKPICTCEKDKSKIKKPIMPRDDFIQCHTTDSHHNYFDFVYGIHDKFDRKPVKQPSKVEIKGLHDTISTTGSCPIHGPKETRPKKARSFSLDCCTATGGLTISIETLGEDKDRFLVQVASNFSKNGAKISTKLVSIVDCNLHTLEENRKEHYTKADVTKQRGHYISICTTGYYNKITQTSGERKKVKRLYHNFEVAHDFILEGSNLILLRYMAIKRFKGEIHTKTVLMGGTICSCTYISHGVSQALVNGKPMFVIKIDRQIFEDSGFMHEAKTVMSLKGHLITHEWSDSNYILHINPLLQVHPDTDDIEDTTPLRQRWRQDMQLLSNYLEFKNTRQGEYEQYLSECEPLQGIVRDYLQTLLLLRPSDALHFTRHYFGNALSTLDLPHNEYFDPCARHVRYHYYED